jgi:hypothetical protein
VPQKPEPPTEDERCPICGRLWREAEQAEWLHLEVTRVTPGGTPGWDSASFCSQAHAAEWLTRPLPPFEPATLMPRTHRDRLADVGLFAMFVVPAILSIVGLIAIGRWLGLYG